MVGGLAARCVARIVLTMRAFLLPGLLLCVLTASGSRAVELGDAAETVIAELGAPTSRVVAGERAIYRWERMEVWFTNGRASRVNERDIDAERAAEARRDEAALTERMRAASRREAESRRAAEAAARAERERPERERRELEQKLLESERERAAADARARALEEAATRTRAARMFSLAKEMSALRLAISEAKAAGEAEKATRLRGVLLAKDKELKLLKNDGG